MMRIRTCVSLEDTDLAAFDEWARENRLPRGAAMGAMVRLVRALSKATIVQHADAHRPMGHFEGARMVAQAVSEAGERIVVLDPTDG